MGGLKHHKAGGGRGGRRQAKAVIEPARAPDDDDLVRSIGAAPDQAQPGAELDHLSSAMPEERIGRTRRVHPYQWLWEPLEADPTFVLRPMFSGRAAYLDGRLMLYFTAKPEPWRGVLVCTDRAHHPSLLAEFPALAPHPILPKWLYLPEAAGGFESTAERLVALARRRDPRLGVDPKLKKRSPRGRRARR